MPKDTTQICVELPKPLVGEVRHRLIDEGLTMRAFMEAAIREKLKRKKGASAAGR